MSTRKLWKVEHGDQVFRPESKTKAYDIYVANASRSYHGARPLSRFARVYVDERDGRGWQLYERVDLAALDR